MNVFKLFACCIPVKGIKNKIICDLQRSDYFLIPDALYEILTTHKNKSISEIKSNYELTDHRFIDEYFEYLEKNECGFWCDSKEISHFPEIDLKFESPELINNAIIDIDKNSNYDLNKVFNELNNLRCKFIEIRSFDNLHADDLKTILHLTSNKIFRNIDVIIKYYKNIETDIIDSNLFNIFNNIGVIKVFSSPNDKLLYDNKLVLSQKEIKSCDDCGKIDIEYFSLNIQTFSEALHFNTCLNKKVSIDTEGNIKNCPAFKHNYGNIDNINISSVIKNQKFSSYWSITKDQINTCKDCEFRYICTDCRAFIDNILDKPKKCNYNPYIGQWE